LPFSAAVASPLLFVGWAGNPVEKVFYHPAVYQRLYQPVSLDATVEMGRLRIELNDTGWVRFRSFDDLIPDHGHLMHLYALRLPELDRVYHLHPEMTAPSTLERALPDMAAGRYLMMADIVHGSGLWEAPQGELGLANAIEGGPFRGDDSGGAARPISEASFEASSFAFENGSRLVWDRPDGLRAEEPVRLAFRLEDREGRVLPDAELYMGMLGHAAIIRHDLQSFAHVHPTGSIPMASLEALNEKKKGPLAHHEHAAHKHAARVVFPYAFPQPGPYRLIIQMKRNGEVKTAFFDAIVEGSVTQTAARK
jgi:hypothetical protein